MLDEIAPAGLQLPSGRRLKLHYKQGQPPWAASRLQDFFGLKETPRVARGQVPIVLHLLAPNQRRGRHGQIARGAIEGLEGWKVAWQIRREELDGFIHGLFGNEESLELPERARRALTALSEMRAMLEGLRVVASDLTKPATFNDIAGALGNVRELTKISEREIHEAVLSCARACRQTLRSMPAAKPTLH